MTIHTTIRRSVLRPAVALAAALLAAIGGLHCELALDVPDRVAAQNLRCNDGVCVCVAGFGDCDAEPGCETDLSMTPEHCAACGHSCLGGECEASACQPIVLAEDIALAFGAGTYPYGGGVVYASRNAVRRIRFDEEIVSEDLASAMGVTGMAIHEDVIYFARARSIASVVPGGDPVEVHMVPPTATIVALTQADGRLLWIEENDTPPHLLRECVLPCESGAAIASVPSDTLPTAVTRWAGQLLWQVDDGSGGALVSVDRPESNPFDLWTYQLNGMSIRPKMVPSSQGLFYTRPTRSQLGLQLLLPDGTSAELAEEDVRDIAVGTEVFVALTGAIVRISANDGAVTHELPGPRNAPNGLSTDSRAIFWFDTQLDMGIVGTLYAVAAPIVSDEP